MSTIGIKIDDYARAHANELKHEEAVRGKSLTKYDIAQLMLSKGALSEKDYSAWMNSREGADALQLSQAQQKALKTGNIWQFAGNAQESYLQSLTDTDAFGIEISTANKKFDYKNSVKKDKVRARIKSIPAVDISYSEIMNTIKFQKMSREEKTEFLLQKTGEMFYAAKEKGDKETMKATLLQGFGLTFAYMDDKSGITDVKNFVKEFSGLNAVVDIIDKLVEDGDNAQYSLGEKSWDAIKGAGDAIDGFIGTEGLVFVGTLQGAVLAAGKMGLGAAFSATTNAVFGVQGVTMMTEGAVGVYNAENEEQTRDASAEFTRGAIFTTGAVKSGVESAKNYKATKNAHAEQVANAKKTLGIEDGVELTAKSSKTTRASHPAGTISKSAEATISKLTSEGFSCTNVKGAIKASKVQYGKTTTSFVNPQNGQIVKTVKQGYNGSLVTELQKDGSYIHKYTCYRTFYGKIYSTVVKYLGYSEEGAPLSSAKQTIEIIQTDLSTRKVVSNNILNNEQIGRGLSYSERFYESTRKPTAGYSMQQSSAASMPTQDYNAISFLTPENSLYSWGAPNLENILFVCR